MKTGSEGRKKKRDYTEAELHRWLQGTDLARLSPRLRFKPASFVHLQPTSWDRLYENFQKSKPISIRLPVRVIHKLKQLSLQKGIGYQALIRMWLTEKLG